MRIQSIRPRRGRTQLTQLALFEDRSSRFGYPGFSSAVAFRATDGGHPGLFKVCPLRGPPTHTATVAGRRVHALTS
jgi:hypothetical protein